VGGGVSEGSGLAVSDGTTVSAEGSVGELTTVSVGAGEVGVPVAGAEPVLVARAVAGTVGVDVSAHAVDRVISRRERINVCLIKGKDSSHRIMLLAKRKFNALENKTYIPVARTGICY
jgi:UDP-N-acetyl-D-mannosaminuronate dehydrogenase